MKKSEKIGIIVVVILLIVLAISIWNGRDKKTTGMSAQEFCETSCIQVDEYSWSSPVTGNDYFDTKEDCVSNCQFRMPK